MNLQEKNARLVEVKMALCRKYKSLAHETASRPKRNRYIHRAEKYRRQAEEIARNA